MQSSTGFPEAGMQSVAPLHGAWQWMLGAGEHAALGVTLGSLGLWAMRRRQARWTWGLLAVLVAVFAARTLGSLAWPLGIAGAVTATLGRTREQRDRDRNGEHHVDHRGPLSACGLLARIAIGRWRVRSRRWFVDRAVLVGYDEQARPAEVPLQGSSGGANTLVAGAAGSGKTVTETWLAVRGIEAGMSAIFIDPKGDRDTAEHLREAAAAAGRPFLEWSPEGPCAYNPYASGSDSEIADRALAGEPFTEPHYLRQAQRFLRREVGILRRAGVLLTAATLAEHLDPDRLEMLLRDLPEAEAEDDLRYLDGLTARQRTDLSGVRDRLAILAESDIGRWLDPAVGQEPAISLLESLRSGAVVLFRLRADSRPLVMQMLGGAIVMDLLAATAALQSRPVPSIVVIDEFAALAAAHVGGLFGRARAAGMSLVLGTQEISDLELPGRLNLLKQVTGNLTCTISHRQVNPESAEWVARLAGSRRAWSATIASDGRRTHRPIEVPRIAPERVRALEPGQAAVIVHDGPTRAARVARMLSVARQR